MDYWKERSKDYNKLDWAKDEGSLRALIKFCDLHEFDNVLDFGCGTGIVAEAIVDKVSMVYGIDSSEDMLKQLPVNPKISRINADIMSTTFKDNFFHKIIGRMVFHHLRDFDIVFGKCNKALKTGGELIIQECGIYEKEETRNWFHKMMSIKEQRYTFSMSELFQLYANNGFNFIESELHINNEFSIRNWLANSGQSVSIQNEIIDLHCNAPDNIKEDFKIRITDIDVIIETRNLIIKGVKC